MSNDLAKLEAAFVQLLKQMGYVGGLGIMLRLEKGRRVESGTFHMVVVADCDPMVERMCKELETFIERARKAFVERPMPSPTEKPAQWLSGPHRDVIEASLALLNTPAPDKEHNDHGRP